MTRARVLVADDLTSMLSAVRALLQDSFDLLPMVSDGQSALDSAENLNPDVVILDISMPVLNGIEVARELKSRASPAKIIFLTIQQDSDIIAACIAAGGTGFVFKSQMFRDLVPAINEVLAGRSFLSKHSS